MSTPPPPAETLTRTPGGWVVSPAFDLLFLANVLWPLLLLPVLLGADGFVLPDGHLQTEFWTIYFITTPHRWITLFVVAADPDRREGHTRLFVGFAVLFAVIVFGVWGFAEELVCLAVLDYLWNSWHFASQHHGVLRMYARKSGGGPDWLERYGLRLFIVYTILRTAGWLIGGVEADAASKWWMNVADLSLVAIPAALLVTNLSGATRARVPKLLYLVSLLGLYCGLLLSLRQDWANGVFVFAAASGLFHAVEYLAVVSHYAGRRRHVGGAGMFREVAKRWVAVLAVYAVALGLIGSWAADPTSGLSRLWLAVNLWAAFLHYTYDGYIWKLRKPATAQALGVSS